MKIEDKLKLLTCPECSKVGMAHYTRVQYGHGDSTHYNHVRCGCGYDIEVNSNWGSDITFQERCEIVDRFYKGDEPTDESELTMMEKIVDKFKDMTLIEFMEYLERRMLFGDEDK